MKTKQIKTLLASLCVAQIGISAAFAATKPNIIYLIADEWRASATGYAGDPNVKTPNLDKLAKQSLNFHNAVSVLPVCTPHRAALMTGRYPTSTGMFLNDAHLPDDELCMAEILGAAGYSTGYIGKWHLDGNGRTAYIPPERRQGWEYWKGAECDHTYNHSHYYEGTSDVKRFWDGYAPYAETKDAQQFIRDHAAGERPFILMVAYGTPHFPHESAPAELKALYPPDKIQLPPNVPAKMQANARKEARGYYAHCTALDRCVGDLMKTIDDTGLANNTIVVFSSDHGESLGSHGVPPKTKQVAWSVSSRVPFLMRVPAMSGHKVETPITTPDVLPTLLGLADVKIPNSVEGEDLSLFIRSGKDKDRAALYMNIAPFNTRLSLEIDREYRAIQTSRYTYVRDLDGPWLLFDDGKDPDQTNNLVGKPENAALVQDLEARLQTRLKKIGDDFRPAASYLKEWGYKIEPHGSVPYDNDGTTTEQQTPRRDPTAKQAE